ncbi:GNAT family N-acetyltransferase [Uliginosibacterium paludis]|uniref:GNAT family N-acetyltransferase n=1 Tax=Uliginosibacterium paludis TaxID=1615952 RepID=A0ABV2CQT8_9RHOO
MIRIASFEPRHAAAVVALILPIQQQEFGLPITLQDQPDLLSIPDFYQRGSGGFWVALEAEQVVGSIALIDIGARRGVIRKMFVAASHRGRARGVAQGLLGALLGHAREAGLAELMLGTTERYLAAHRFYERNGFERIDEAALPADFPRMQVDSRFYRLTLTGRR